MVEHSEFDTIYHDRFSYLSLLSLVRIFAVQGLRIYDARRIKTHGGSLRVRACHADDAGRATRTSVAELLAAENAAGLTTAAYYEAFMGKARTAKFDLRAYLRKVRPVATESDLIRKLPPALRRLVSLLGRMRADRTLAADLRQWKLPARLPTSGALKDAKRGITLKLTRVGQDAMITEVHLGEKYDGPLPFKFPPAAMTSPRGRSWASQPES